MSQGLAHTEAPPQASSGQEAQSLTPSRTSPRGHSGLGHSAQPQSPHAGLHKHCLSPQVVPGAACPPRGVWGLYLGSPHQPVPGLLGKEPSISINNGLLEDEIILGFSSFPRGGNASLRRYGCPASGKIVQGWTGRT